MIFFVFSFFEFGCKKNLYAAAEAGQDEQISTEEVFEELNDGVNEIVGQIDTDVLDEFLNNDFNLDFFSGLSFKDLVLSILSGTYFENFGSLSSGIVGIVKSNIKSMFSFFFSLFVVVAIFELFHNFCSNKYGELKGIVKIIFSLIIVLMISVILKDLSALILESVNKIFSFSKVLFPILLSLILLTGANGTYSVYNSLSIFLVNTGTYLFIYILMPIAISVMTISLVGCIFKNKRFLRVNEILKSIFKYLLIAFIGIFGIFAAINLVSSGVKDGVTYKLTKFAIKSYIPILGGYLSDGFDFVHTCSVLVKNSFGVCGILVLLFMVLKPLLICFVCTLMFKALSVFVLFVGNEYFSDVFDSISKSFSYFITVLVGIFMCLFIFIYILILSVSVV